MSGIYDNAKAVILTLTPIATKTPKAMYGMMSRCREW